MAKLLIFVFLCLLCNNVLVSAAPEDDLIAAELEKIKVTINGMPAGKEKDLLLKGFGTTSQDTNNKVTGIVQKTKVKDMLASINSAMPKFQSGEPTKILSGCGDVLFGIALSVGGPYGLAFAAVASLFSAVMNMISPQKVEKSLESIIEEALKKQRDSELKDEAHGITTLFRNYKAAQDRFRISLFNANDTVTDSDILALAPHDKIYEPTKFTGILSRRINTATEKNAQSTLEFVILSAQLCKLHLSILIDVKTLIDLSGRMPATASMVGGVIEQSKIDCRDNIDFLRLENMDGSFYRLLGFYYPPKQSPRTEEVDRFLDILQVPPIVPFEFTENYRYVLSPETYQGIVMCGVVVDDFSLDNVGIMETKRTIEGCNGENNKHVRNTISPVENGYFEITVGTVVWATSDKQVNQDTRSRLCAYEEYGDILFTQKAWNNNACQGNNIKFSFVPIDTSANKFLIEPKIKPGSFLYLPAKIDKVLKVASKDPGKKGYWMDSS